MNKIWTNYIGKLLPLVGFLTLLFACEDKTEDYYKSYETYPVTLSDLDISILELDANFPNNPTVTFTWTEADFHQQTVPNYDLEFSLDEEFSNPSVVASIKGDTSLSFNTTQMNAAVGDAGFYPFEWSTVNARIVASLGVQKDLPVASSNTISFEVLPYFNYTFSDIYLVGPASGAGWDNNNNNPPMFRDSADKHVFRYTGFFNGDDLKIVEERGSWAPQYGGTGGALLYRPTEDDEDPSPIGDIKGNSGYYTFTANIDDLEYSLEPFDASSVAAMNSVSLSGSALNADTALQQYGYEGTVFDPHIWYISSVHLTPGILNFIANESESWGGSTPFSGVATAGGEGIDVVVEDDYEVWFNDLTGDYIMIPLNL